MPGKTLLNGNEIEPGLSADRAFHFGDGLFETIAVKDGNPCLWNLHMRRLRKGCEALGLPMPDADVLLAESGLLVNGQDRAVLKLILSSGAGGRGYARPEKLSPSRWLQISPWPDSVQYRDNCPLAVQWCEIRLPDQPRLAGIKHLNRLEQVLARGELSDKFHEGLLCDQHGNVIEGIASNLLLKLDGRYITPALSRCGVAGVVRRLLLDRASNRGVKIDVVHVTREQVIRAERVFLTNALLGIRPVASLDGQNFSHVGFDDEFLAETHAACFTLKGAA